NVAGGLGMTGDVAFSGDAPLGFSYALLSRLHEVAPGIRVDARQPDVVALGMSTKDAAELEKIRSVSRGAVVAMGRVRDYLGALRAQGDGFRDATNAVATLGHVRAVLRRAFSEQGLAEDGESIVSQGRDAGVPHNRGNDAEPIRAGRSIIVDIFPGEAGGGYHTDMTRTFCVGEAPEALRRVYADCRATFDVAMQAVAVGRPCRAAQEAVCDAFERQGHATGRSNAGTQEGYVHGLGHGVGLAVHEGPRLGGGEANRATLAPGHVVSVEPGLYYPSREIGVRIEDLVAVLPDGRIENLTPFPYELEVNVGAHA
ncbi:MAG TPA: M24 family metallopeptidase, partial [Candidatus Acidoferrales bacterium]|nr:M24 family metallopeptidase [Candidatus Acidoferrales bacterium]